MKAEELIKTKIKSFEKEAAYYSDQMRKYKWTEIEKKESSTRYGRLQESESCFKAKADLLKWVLT